MVISIFLKFGTVKLESLHNVVEAANLLPRAKIFNILLFFSDFN